MLAQPTALQCGGFNAILSLFCDEQIICITGRLQKPTHVLPSMDRFNRLFQKSSVNPTCELYVETSRLVAIPLC